MATITQRISLEGADDIRKKLEDLGKAGAAAFKQIQDAAAKPIVDPAQIDRTKQGFDNLAVAAKNAGTAIAQTGEQAKVAGEQAGTGLLSAATKFGLAAGAIVVAVSAVVRSLVAGAGDAAQKIQDQADVLGLTVQQWTALRRAIDVAGNSSEEFAHSVAPLMQGLNKMFAESGNSFMTFANGATVSIQTVGKLSAQSQQLQDALLKLGVRRDIIDKGSLATMNEVARIIAGMPEGTAKAAAGLQFFGAKWRDVVDSLSVGKAVVDIDNLGRASRQLAPELQNAAKGAKNAWDDLGRSIEALKNLIGAVMAPSSTTQSLWLTKMIDGARVLLTTFLELDKAGREDFLQNLEAGPGATAFRILIALGEQLGGIWRDVLVPAGEKLFGVVNGIALVFEGITGSQVVAFFITAAIAAAGFALALKAISLLLIPLTMLGSLFSPFGAALVIAAAAAVMFWDKLKAGAEEAAALIPVQLQDIADSFKKLFAGDFAGFWAQFSNAAVEAFDKIRKSASESNWVKGILDTLAQIPDIIKVVAGSFLALVKVLDAVAIPINAIFGTKLTGSGILLIEVILQMTIGFQLLASVAVIVGTAFSIMAAIFSGPVAAAIIGFAVLVLASWDQIKAGAAAVMGFFDGIAERGNAMRDAVISAIASIIAKIGELASSISGAIWDAFASAGVAAWNAITNAINGAIDAIRSFLGLGGGSSSGVPPDTSGGHAAGGLIGGRGNGTSDSNLAWVSRGEHIMPAAAVAQPGVLAFLEALRRSGGDLGRVLDGLGRFALGGPVGLPALAGGSSGGMSHVTIQFPGLPEIAGLRASSVVVEELQRAAAMAQVRSGGRKPSRYT